jgi:HSP20 family protein
MALMRSDPFRELDRFAEQVMAGSRVPQTMPLEAFRRGDQFFVYIDLPGVDRKDVDLTVERNVISVRAERRSPRQEGATSSSSTSVRRASSPGSCSSATTSTPAA